MTHQDPINPADWLAELSAAIRHSSLKRLRKVPSGLETWRPVPEAMSFTDIAYHLVLADEWLFEKLKRDDLAPMQGGTGIYSIAKRADYLELLDKLDRVGWERTRIIRGLSVERLERRCFDARYEGEVAAWWIIARGNLDHEAHHRGQLALYLRMCGLT